MNENTIFEYNAPNYVDFINGIHDDSADCENFFNLGPTEDVKKVCIQSVNLSENISMDDSQTVSSTVELTNSSAVIDQGSKIQNSLQIEPDSHSNKEISQPVTSSMDVEPVTTKPQTVFEFKAPIADAKQVSSNETTFSKPQSCFKSKIYNKSKDCVARIETDKSGLSVELIQVAHRGVKSSYKNKITEPEPFSFYEKEVERFKKKEEKIQKFIEEEKKLHEFHANPVPKYLYKAKKHYGSSSTLTYSTTSSNTSTCSSLQDTFMSFKAHEPTVLYKQPFMPRKSIKPLCQIDNFVLHTEERKYQREVYETAKKERELAEQYRQQELERERRKREEYLYRLARKSTVHRPVPLPSYIKK